MGFKPLWTPWRSQFVLKKKKQGGCIFCDLPKENNDKSNVILYRGKFNYVILNKYPYTSGHLMVVPFKHTGNMAELSSEETAEIMDLCRHSIASLKEGYSPEAFNLGMNIGAAAGAGIKEHLHMHIVPRWTGDSNFLPLISDVKPLPQLLSETFETLHPYFRRLSP